MMELNYEAYDRQLDNLISMSEILTTEWEDCGTQELTFDILSLQAKVSRLCYLADIDYALQSAELKHNRLNQNLRYHTRFDNLLANSVSPFMRKVINHVRETKTFEGHKHPSVAPVLSTFMPRLAEVMSLDGFSTEQWNMNMQVFEVMEKVMAKNVKHAVMPGMRYEERLWRLFQFYAQLCYLFYHFHRVSQLCRQEVEEQDAGRLLTAMVQRYTESEDGSRELQRFEAVMLYNNDNKVLSIEQLTDARKKLIDEVPPVFQLCYIRHIEDIDRLAQEIINTKGEAEDIAQFVAVIAKWQLLTSRINELSRPRLEDIQLYNDVFVELRHDRPLNLRKLRERIEKMIPLITRKNHWFCVWCVLNHHNLLTKTDFEAFARQMMHNDWFGNITNEKHFSGDTLREYTGYFTSFDYTQWQKRDFLLYKERHNKTRWADTLWDKFQRLCYDMDEEFES